VIKERYIFFRDLNIELLLYSDPVIRFFMDTGTGNETVQPLSDSTGIPVLFLCLSSVMFYLRSTEYTRSVFSAVFSGAALTFLLYVMSPDLILHFLLLPLIIMLTASSLRSIVFPAILYVWGAVVSGPLSFLFVLLSLSFDSKSKSIFSLALKCLLLAAAFFLTLYFSSKSLIFDYPPDARLVPISDFLYLGNVCFGPDRIPFTLYDLEFLSQYRNMLYLVLLAGCVPVLLLFYNVRKRIFSGSFQGSFYSAEEVLVSIFVLIVAVSSIYINSGFTGSPSGVLMKCFPGLIWRPVPVLTGGLFIVVLFTVISSHMGRKQRLFSVMISLVSVLGYITLTGPDGMRLFRDSNETVYVKNHSISDVEKLSAVSPSLKLIKTVGEDDYLKIYSNRELPLENVPLRDTANCTASASRNSGEAYLALDGNHQTRWSTAGPQMAGDWFGISCSEPVSVRQIHLSVVFFKSDFPRGILVQSDDSGELTDIVSFDDWSGSLKYTSLGYPYFGPQSDVVIDLPEETTARKFRFTLTRGDSVFDWSIAKILFLN
jgi:hypothetical protein